MKKESEARMHWQKRKLWPVLMDLNLSPVFFVCYSTLHESQGRSGLDAKLA